VVTLVVGVAAQLGISAASADTLRMSPTPVYDCYVGRGALMNHQTGFVPNTNNMSNLEKYEPGGKVFVGWHFDEDWATELSFDYFGESSFYEGLLTISKKRSFAVTGTVLWFTPPRSTWTPLYNGVMPGAMGPVRLFPRGGRLQDYPPRSL